MRDSSFEHEPGGIPNVVKLLIGLAAVGGIALLALILFREEPPEPPPEPLNPDEYLKFPNPQNDWARANAVTRLSGDRKLLGMESCRPCHEKRVREFETTNHYLTSRQASEKTILGSFQAPRHIHATDEPELSIHMRRRDDQFFQAAVLEGQPPQEFEFPINLVIGSGRTAQTYLSWRRNWLYELPVSYSSQLDCWVKSPGYLNDEADFSRPVNSQCLRCHVTYVEELPERLNQFSHDKMLLGISCERCHGSGVGHIRFHREKQGEDTIVKPAELPRQQKIELCSQCHGGDGEKFHQPIFSYHPGQPLEQFMKQEKSDGEKIGLHTAGEYGRLQRSPCFQQSEMTCTTCHNPHKNELGRAKLFSQRCIQCHEVEQCSTAHRLGEVGRERCVDCHMPKVRVWDTDLAAGDRVAYPILHDHKIGIYEELSREVEEEIGEE